MERIKLSAVDRTPTQERTWSRERVQEMGPLQLWIELGIHRGHMGTKERTAVREGHAVYWGSPIEYYWLGDEVTVGALYEDGRQVHPIDWILDQPFFNKRPKDQSLQGPKSWERRGVKRIQQEQAEAKQVLAMLGSNGKLRRPTIQLNGQTPTRRPVIIPKHEGITKKPRPMILKKRPLPFKIKGAS